MNSDFENKHPRCHCSGMEPFKPKIVDGNQSAFDPP